MKGRKLKKKYFENMGNSQFFTKTAAEFRKRIFHAYPVQAYETLALKWNTLKLKDACKFKYFALSHFQIYSKFTVVHCIT